MVDKYKKKLSKKYKSKKKTFYFDSKFREQFFLFHFPLLFLSKMWRDAKCLSMTI
jgi:hypothetical protein